MLERIRVYHKHAMGSVYLCEIQAGVVVDRVTVFDNNKICVYMSDAFLTIKISILCIPSLRTVNKFVSSQDP